MLACPCLILECCKLISSVTSQYLPELSIVHALLAERDDVVLLRIAASHIPSLLSHDGVVERGHPGPARPILFCVCLRKLRKCIPSSVLPVYGGCLVSICLFISILESRIWRFRDLLGGLLKQA